MLAAMPSPAVAAKRLLSEARVDLINTDKESVGTGFLRETPTGILIHLTLQNVPEGVHGIHLHEVGKCDTPDFKSAGGHVNPMALTHGIMNTKGFHLGDLPNIHVGSEGKLEFEVWVPESSLDKLDKNLLDEDGAALVIHEGADDYTTDPAGAAGPRIACGIIEKK
jgi:Cu-Zn family superoxide dismutase